MMDTENKCESSNVDELEKNLIDELVSIRKEQGISQVELSKLTGFSQQTLSRFEQKMHGHYLSSILSVADALGYDLELKKRK